MLVRGGRESEGRNHLEAVLKPAEVHYNVGSVYESLGRREQAKSEYEKALTLDPALSDAQARLDDLRASPTTRPTESPVPAGVSLSE
jgi:tetratricopeptide (TPR) repeat protein